METVKIVFDVDSKDIKTTTDELKALNKITNEEVASLEKLSQSAEDAGDGFISLRTQVKQAKEEAQKAAEKYGEFSKEANAARQKAGALADQMGDLNRQVSLLNPEAKAKAFSNLAQSVVGAFSIATGALQAFGVKNKEVEALAMKLQGALNITQGIASIGNLKESFNDLKVILGFTTGATGTLTAAQRAQAIAAAQAAAGTATLTAAQEADAIAAAQAAAATRGFTASLLTNPIFLVVAAIGALAAAYMTLNEEVKSAILNEEELKEAKKKTTELKNKELQTSIDLLVANKDISKQEGERRKIEAKRLEDTTDLIKKLADLDKEEKKNNETIKEKTKLAETYLKESGASAANLASNAAGEAIAAEKRNKEIIKSRKVYQDQLSAINKTAYNETQQQNISETEDKDAANKKQLASDEAAAAKRKQIRDKEIADKEKAWQDEYKLIQLRQQNQVDDTKSNQEKLALQQKFAVENFQYELKHLQETSATVAQLQILWEQYYAKRTSLSSQQDKIFQDSCDAILKAQKDFIDKMNGIASKEKSPVEKIQEENDAIDAAYAEQYAMAVKNGDDTTAITEAYLKAVEAQQKKLTEVVVSEDEKRKKSGEETAMARYNREKEAMDRTIQATNELMNTLRSIQSAQYNQEIIDAEKQKEQGLLSEEEYQKKLKEIKHRQDVADKNAAIFKATLDFASAMINALKAPPLAVPAQLAFTAAIAGLNLAKIIATPLPKYQKGTLSVPGMDMGKDSVHAMLQPGEAVIPVSTNRAYHPTIKAIYEKKISPSEINNFVMSRTKAGGSSSVTANVDTYALGRVLSKNKGVQIENANLVGKAIAKEIGSRFNARNII